MTNYYRLMLGRSSIYAQQCYEGSFIGTDYEIHQDLSGNLPERWQDFNEQFRPAWMSNNPGKSKVAAGLACGALHTVSKGILPGDIVLCPDGQGFYRVGEVTGTYSYAPGDLLPHRRPVRWLPKTIRREDMSIAMRHSMGFIGTVSNVTKYADEIEALLGGQQQPSLIATDQDVEDPSVFGLEKHLEEFLVANWASTELGKNYDIYEIEGELVGQQFPSDTGPMDILAVSKDKRELLVVELKKGRASDVVVGQVQRYMGYAQDELAEVGPVGTSRSSNCMSRTTSYSRDRLTLVAANDLVSFALRTIMRTRREATSPQRVATSYS
jgi:restriction system protein